MTDIDPTATLDDYLEGTPCPNCGYTPIAVVEKTGRSCRVVSDNSCIVTDVGIEWEFIHLSDEHLP